MKKSHKAWRKQVTPPMKYGPMANARRIMKAHHLEQYPNCTYGDEPHFVPPSFGQVGFYMCDPPKDITNHNRCRPPYNHEHPDHEWGVALGGRGA